MSKITHKQRVQQIYPSSPQEKGCNGTHLSSLIYYAQSRPAKLTKLSAFLVKTISKDLQSNKTENVAIGMEIMDALIRNCASNLRFFSESILELVLELLNTNDIQYVQMATETFEAFSTNNKEQSNSTPSLFPGYRRCIDYFITISTGSQQEMKINGVKGIEAVIVDQNMSKIETEHILKKVLPVVFAGLSVPQDYSVQVSADNLFQGQDDEINRICVNSLQGVVRRTSVFSLKWIVESLFGWLNETNNWSPHEFPIYIMQIIMISLHPQYYQALISEVLKALDNYNGNSSNVKTNMIKLLNFIILAVKDSVSVSVLELLDSFLERLVASLNPKKDEGDDEVGFHQAIIDSIGTLASRMEVVSMRNDCLEFVLKRLETESHKVMKTFKGDEAEAQLVVLKLSFLKILEKIIQSFPEVENVLISYPTELNISLFALFKDDDPGVRVAVHGIIQLLLAQTTSAKIPEAKLFVSSNFGIPFHQSLLSTCMQVSVTPIDLVAIHNTLVSLSTCFTLNHFRYSFPLIFKLQESAENIDGSPKQRGAHNLVLSYLISIATLNDSKSLLTYLSNLKEKRIEASQWLPTLDFLPGEIKTHRGKQLKDLDKKRKDQPSSTNTLVSKEKFFELLIADDPSLKPFVIEFQVSFDALVEESNSALAQLPQGLDERRKSIPFQSQDLEAEIRIINPFVFQTVIKDPFSHSFDHISLHQLDDHNSVLQVLEKHVLISTEKSKSLHDLPLGQ